MTTLTLFSAPGIGQGELCCAVISPQLETSDLIQIGRKDPWGVMDISNVVSVVLMWPNT